MLVVGYVKKKKSAFYIVVLILSKFHFQYEPTFCAWLDCSFSSAAIFSWDSKDCHSLWVDG